MLYYCDCGFYQSNTDAGGFWGSGPHAEAEGRGERRRPLPQEANGAGKLRGSTFSPGKGSRRPSVEDYFRQTLRTLNPRYSNTCDPIFKLERRIQCTLYLEI